MAATSIGSLTLGGFGAEVLTLSAGGFNVVGTTTLNASGTLNVNSGGVMTNGTLNMSVQTSAVNVSSGGSMTNTTTSVSNNGSNDGGPLKVNGGNVSLGNVTIRRSGATIFSSGLTILGGSVSANNISVGTGNSYDTMSVGGGTLNISGNLTVGNSSSVTVGRAYQYLQTNGTVTCQGTLTMGAAGTGSKNFFTVQQGAVFNASGVVLFPNSVSSITNNFTNAATIYLGGSGFTLPNASGNNYNVSLNNGALFGASTNWTGSMNATLPSGTFTFSPADLNGNGQTISLSGILSGAGGLLVTNAGTLALANTNTYSGNTTIGTGSTLQLGDGINSNGVVAGNITNNGTLTVANPNSQTITATTIIGGGSLVKSGAGVLAFVGTNTSIGGTTIINAGTLQLGDGATTDGALPGNITDNANGTLAVANPTAQTLVNVVTGGGSLAKSGAGTLTIGVNETYAGSTTVNAGGLVVGSGSSISSTQNVTIASGALFDVSASTPGSYTVGSGYVFTAGHTSGSGPDFSGNLTNNGAISVPAGGTLTLNGNLSLMNGGSNVFNLGSTPGTGSTIALTGGAALHLNGTTTIQINFSVLGVGTYPLISGASSVSGGTNNLNLVMNGSLGVLTAGLQVTATGVNLVVQGNLHNLVWQGDGAANSWDNSTGNTDWSNTVTHAADYFVSGYYVTFDDSGSANQPILNNVVSPATTTVNGSSSYTFSGGGYINSGSLTNNSSGTLKIQTANTYSGGTTINAGTVEVDNGGAIGTGPVLNNSALVFNRSDTGNNAGVISGSGTVTMQNGGTETLSAANTYSGGTTIAYGTIKLGVANAVPGGLVAGDVTINGSGILDLAGLNDTINALSGNGIVDTIEGGSPTLTVGGNGDSGTFNGSIQNTSGTMNLAKNGSGTETLGNENFYGGSTTIANGTLQMANFNTLPVGTTIILGGSGTAGALDLDGNSQQVAGLALGSGAVGTGQIIGNSGSSPSILTYTNGGTSTFGGTIQDVLGSGTSTVALTVNGGSLVLNGTNNYSGGTTINSGGNSMLTVSGGLLAGTTLTMNSANASQGFLLSGGTASFSGNVSFSTDNGNNANYMALTNGTFNASSFSAGRTSLSFTTQPATGQATSLGVYVNGATMNITNTLGIGTPSGANSSASMRVDKGAVNVGGTTTITINNATRWSILDVNGGAFTSTDATGAGIQIGGVYAGAEAEFLIRSGVVSADTITFGGTNGIQTSGADVLNMTGGTLYVGSGGIVSGSNAPTYTETITVGTATVGALASWSSSLPMTLSGITTFQAADANSNAFNIALNGALSGSTALTKTGNGTLTLGATNNYSGSTLINGGTMAIGAGGLISSPSIIVGSNTVFDVSQVTGGFTLNGSQALKGFGTVTGLVTAASGSIIYPGSNSVTGTLTLMSGLTESGGVNNTFNLSTNASGSSNDFINVSGNLTVSGSNPILINGSVQSGSAYPLISYAGGTFSGSTANFSVSGATGTLSNSPTAKIIYFVAQGSVRASTNVTWLGNAIVNNWDTEITTNWLNNGTGLLDIFVPGDNVLFSNLGAINPLINLVSTVTPNSITVNTTSNYTFTGTGSIGGGTSLTVSNGTLTVLTTNNYTGQTIVNNGVLATLTIANSGSPSSIGAATSDPTNLMLNGGTLSYLGGSTSTDHGITLTNTGGTIGVVGGTALTLNGSLTGNGNLTKVGNGTLILPNANSYTGSTAIGGGAIQIDNVASISSGAITFSNGTLAYPPSAGITVANPFNFTSGTTNMIIATSSGGANPLGNGVWSGGGVVLVSNTVIYTVNGILDPFTGTISLVSPNGSQFRFNSGGGNTMNGSTNATFDLGTGTASLTDRNGSQMNLGALQGASGTSLQGQDAGSGTTTWTIGNNNLNTTFSGIIEDGTANRISAVTKVGTGTLTLQGVNTYSGLTTINSGVLALSYNPTNTTDGSIAGGTINLVSGAVLDVSGRSDATLMLNNQLLEGGGMIRGNLDAYAGTVAPGGGISGNIGTLTVTSNVLFESSSTVWMKLNRASSPNSDQILASNSISYGNQYGPPTLVVTNIGAALQIGDTFKLFGSGTTNYSGSFDPTTIVLPPLLGSAQWNTSNLAVNGTISVVGPAPPSFSSIMISGSDIVLNAIGGTPNGSVTVLTSTNITVPLAQWTTVTTGNFDGSGNFTYTVSGALSSGSPQQFYILKQ
jgi:autotransporter-associated beta strand protein